MDNCPACQREMLQRVVVVRPLYIVGLGRDGSLWGIWEEHGPTTSGLILALAMHLFAIGDQTFGRGRWAVRWRHPYDHLCYQLMPLENGSP